jgi:hypothetical protein
MCFHSTPPFIFTTTEAPLKKNSNDFRSLCTTFIFSPTNTKSIFIPNDMTPQATSSPKKICIYFTFLFAWVVKGKKIFGGDVICRWTRKRWHDRIRDFLGGGMSYDVCQHALAVRDWITSNKSPPLHLSTLDGMIIMMMQKSIITYCTHSKINQERGRHVITDDSHRIS